MIPDLYPTFTSEENITLCRELWPGGWPPSFQVIVGDNEAGVFAPLTKYGETLSQGAQCAIWTTFFVDNTNLGIETMARMLPLNEGHSTQSCIFVNLLQTNTWHPSP